MILCVIDSQRYFLINNTRNKHRPCLFLLTAEQIFEETAYGHNPETIELDQLQKQEVSFVHPHTPVKDVYLQMSQNVR